MEILVRSVARYLAGSGRSKASVFFQLWLVGVTPAFAQTTDAMLSGAVRDPSGAVVPRAALTAQNLATGVLTKTTSSDSGIYWLALQPGVYRLTAEHAGFRKLVYNDLPLDVGARLNLNLTLQIGEVTESVEVNAAEATALAAASSSVGFVIGGEELESLPLPDRNVLGLASLAGGVVANNFNGSRRGALNITLDGINVQNTSVNAGLGTLGGFKSTDRIAAFRVVTSPADAEYGRGSGQIQMLSRSGANEFHGSLFESHRNTVLNANPWFNNQRGVDPTTGAPISPRDILIRNQFGGRLGGRLIRNKTFFHVLFDGQRERTKNSVPSTTLTEPARRGLFRFFPGVQNGNANAAVPTVDLSGNPLRPAQATGALQAVSVFGRDPNRLAADRSGVIGRMMDLMPLPNNFRMGDGLNTAGYTWARGASSDFDQISIRLDHLLSTAHRLGFTYTRQDSSLQNNFLPQNFPTTPGGDAERKSRLYTLAITSTLRPNLLNEFRAGALRYQERNYAPWERGGTALQPQAGNEPYLPVLGAPLTSPFNIAGDPNGRTAPLYQYGNTLAWLKNRHAFKAGGEVRFTSVNYFSAGATMPRVNLGPGGAQFQNINTIPLIGQNLGPAQTLLANLAGSVGNVVQAFNSPGGPNPVFLPGEPNQRTWRQREFSFFFKDDVKVTPNLTLNLGIRYEWYGVPFEANGKAVAPVGGAAGLFGLSGAGFDDLFQPGRLAGALTRQQTVGPRSQNPGLSLYQNDNNNFAPAVGLSWAVPWFGAGKTVARLGYGMGYERNSLSLPNLVSGEQPGLREQRNFTTGSYLDLSGVRLPLAPLGRPLDVAPLNDRTQILRAYDDHLRTPYIQNWNAGLQRQLTRNTVLDVRYVGSKGTRLIRSADVNEINIFETGILDAFRVTQAGGNSPLLDRIFLNLPIPGLGVVDGTRITGSDALRFTNPVVLGNHGVGGLAGFLNFNPQYTGQNGGLLRRVGLPENWVVANPQYAQARLTSNFASSTYHALQVEVMRRFSAGWTMGGNYTWSRALGEEEGDSPDLFDSFRTLRNRRLEKRLLGFHRTHVINSYGMWDLPFGPGKKFAGGGRGVLARLIEGWQIAPFLSITSGAPVSLMANVNSWNSSGDNTPVALAAFPKSAGSVQRTGQGVVYFDGFRQVPDPSIAGLTTAQNIRGSSTLRAIADASGRLLLVNATPGVMGNLAPRFVEGPGEFHLDLSLLKRIAISERKNLELRADAIGFTNSPNFGLPINEISNPNLGRIMNATGNRIVVVSIRFNF